MQTIAGRPDLGNSSNKKVEKSMTQSLLSGVIRERYRVMFKLLAAQRHSPVMPACFVTCHHDHGLIAKVYKKIVSFDSRLQGWYCLLTSDPPLMFNVKLFFLGDDWDKMSDFPKIKAVPKEQMCSKFRI